MTIRYTVEADQAALKEVVDLFEFLGGNTERATSIAINKAGAKIRTAASKEIRSQVRLKAKYVNGRLKFIRANPRNLTGVISTPSRGLLMTRYSTDPMISGEKVSWIKPPPVPARGIRIKVKPSGPVRVIDGDDEIAGRPFYMVLKQPQGRLVIAGRRKVPGKEGGKIKVFYGPSLSQVFTDVKSEVPAGQILTEEMADAIRYLLRKQLPQE